MRIRVDDIAMRVASVGLALSLWFAVAARKNAQAPVDAPIEFRNVPERLEVVGAVPRTLEVWLRGAPGMVQRLKPGEVYVQIDLRGAAAGPRTAYVAAGDVRAPYALQVAAIRPASFPFVLEPSLQRTLPVKARLEGRPANGFRVIGVRCDPETVNVIGPKSRMAALESMATQPVVVEQAQITLVREVGIELPDPLVRVVDPRPVRVTAQIGPVAKP
jgi:YbbR domain-containing protein